MFLQASHQSKPERQSYGPTVNSKVIESHRVVSTKSKRMYGLAKRSLDIFFALLSLLLLSPLLIAVSLILKCSGEHLVFFKQERIGLNGARFHLYKFVTMVRDSELFGTITAKDDARVLPVGKVLRRTKLNELPQLLNLLMGDISIVGPRPLASSDFQHYPQRVQLEVYDDNKPGITGVGSIFFRSEDEITAASDRGLVDAYAEEVMPIKGAFELWYREHKSLCLDFKIVLLTALVIVAPRSSIHMRAFPDLPMHLLDEYAELHSKTS